MNFFELLQYLGGNVWIYGGVFLLILGVLVFVHEWGHYIVARWCGVKVETFSIGFGKEIIGFNDKKGTRWKISMVPLGGFVKLYGDVDPASYKSDDTVKDGEAPPRPMTAEERKGAFFAKKVWQRAAIVIAGPAINYIFAIIVLTLLFTLSGQPVTPPLAAAVIGGSSADKHGFQPHDHIISIDGQTITNFEDIRREMMISLDQERHFVIERGGKTVDIYAKPEKVEEKDRFGFQHSRGLLGLISPRHAVDISTIRKINGKAYAEGQTDEIRAELLRRMDTQFPIEVARGEQTDKLIIHPLKEFNEALSLSSGQDADHAAEAAADTDIPDAQDANILIIADQKGNVLIKYSPLVAAGKALQESVNITSATLEALGQMVMGTRSATELGGVIRIGALAGDMAKQGIIAVILFTALLSINLGLVNMFPVPMLDGGHLLFYSIEAILGRPIPEQIQEYAFRMGLVFLVGIMVFANLSDLVQLLL